MLTCVGTRTHVHTRTQHTRTHTHSLARYLSLTRARARTHAHSHIHAHNTIQHIETRSHLGNPSSTVDCRSSTTFFCSSRTLVHTIRRQRHVTSSHCTQIDCNILQRILLHNSSISCSSHTHTRACAHTHARTRMHARARTHPPNKGMRGGRRGPSLSFTFHTSTLTCLQSRGSSRRGPLPTLEFRGRHQSTPPKQCTQ